MSNWFPSASWPVIELRARILRTLRRFFDERGFLEVETPILSSEVAVERHLDPLRTTLFADPREPAVGPGYWLQTSPEAAMKRLMAAGAGSEGRAAIYQVTRAFRGGEIGPRHNPEFTIVEWYRRGDSMADGMRLVSDLAESLLARGGADRTSYAAAMRLHAGVDAHQATIDELAACAVARGIGVPPTMTGADRDAWLNLLLAELVEPHLGRVRPTILYDYPASQAAFAEIAPPEPTTSGEASQEQNFLVAKRFELYVDGTELANGYFELTDAEELARRMDRANDQRVADGKSPLPPATRLVHATRGGFGPCVGVALGFDRVVMLAGGAREIADVIAFAADRA
jgi:lysyl-tRNA synthetase class 2